MGKKKFMLSFLFINFLIYTLLKSIFVKNAIMGIFVQGYKTNINTVYSKNK